MAGRLKMKTGHVWPNKVGWRFQTKPRDPLPIKEPKTNNRYGPRRLWNPILGRNNVLFQKAEDWGYPKRDPPPKGLRESPEAFGFFWDKYFPDVECRLVLDSVINIDTNQPAFEFPPTMSKAEIANYLRSVYGMENIVRVDTKNFSGRTFKNEFGLIKQLPDVKSALVTLDAPVRIDFKQVKTTEEGEQMTMGGKQPDAKK